MAAVSSSEATQPAGEQAWVQPEGPKRREGATQTPEAFVDGRVDGAAAAVAIVSVAAAAVVAAFSAASFRRSRRSS